MAIPLHKGVGGNLKRFVASEPVEVPGDLKVTGNTNLPLQNASIVETIDIDVSSTGTVVSLDLEKSGGGNLTVQLSEDWLTYTAGSVNLTAGSDIAPQINYVYIEDQTGTATLVASTVGWPVTEHAPVATVLVQSAASAQTDGAYKVHAWTDHLKATNDMGHLAHINFWIRQQQATYISGVVQTLDIQSGPDPDDVFFSNTAGEVLQLHPHAFPALDMETGSPLFVVNDSTTAYNRVTNLNTVLTDSTGTTMSGKFFSLVIWGVVSEKSVDCQLMCNLPSGSYNTQTGLVQDSNKYADYSIPPEFVGTGFLIAELQLQHNAGANTWTLVSLVDLRGLLPAIQAGGGGTGGNEFPDNLFRIFDEGDDSKKLAFQVSGITTATTRTITVPDADITVDDDGASRPPNGSASGGLGGTYPSPSVNGMTGGALTDDTAHGTRGGGALHADVIAGGADGFMTGADKTKLDGIDAGAEANTASNVGTDGVGVWYQKTGVDLEFRHVAPGSSKVTTTLNGQDIDVDVVEGNLVHQNLSGAGTNTHGQIDTHIGSAANPHSVTMDQLTTGTDAWGDVAFRGTSAWERLAAGTSGQLLQTNGAGAAPSWVTASGTGDVTGPASSVDNTIPRFDSTTGKVIQGGGTDGVSGNPPTYDDVGNLMLDATGSTTSLPRLIGANGFIAGGAIRWQFDNGNTVIQNSHGGAMTIASFHAIVLRGNKGAGAPSFDTDTDKAVLVQGTTVGDPLLVVRGANGQTAALTEWRDTVTSDTVLLSIDDEGNIVSANNNLTGIKNAGFNSWGNPTVSASAVTVDYTAYQGASVSLPTGTTAITLNTPTAGPGAYKLILINSVAITGVTWVTQGTEVMYGPSGTVAVATASGDRTLIGLIWDGSAWHVVSSQPMQSVTVT